MRKASLEQDSAGSGLTRDTLVIIAATTLSNVLAIFRESLFASKFGTGPVADAYVIAFSACSALFLLLSSGNVSFAFIPQIQRLRGNDEQNSYYSAILVAVGVVSLAVTLFVAINSELIITILAQGASASTQLLASRILRAISPIILFAALGSVFQAALNNELFFVSPAIIPALANIIFIAILLLAKQLSLESQIIYACVASFSVWLVLIISVSKLYRPFKCKRLSLSLSYLKNFAYAMTPLLAITAIDQVVLLIQKFSLSYSGPGSISVINYAYRLESIPVGLVAAAFSTAVFPRLSNYSANNDRQNLSGVFNYGFEAILLIALPVTVLCIALARPAVEILLMRGSFSSNDVDRVAISLAFYSIGILPQILTVYFSRLILSTSSYMTLFKFAAVTSFVFIPLVMLLPRLIGEIGIPVATSINGFLYSFLLLRKGNAYVDIPYNHFRQLFIKAGSAALIVVILFTLLSAAFPSPISIVLVSVLALTAYCFAVYKFVPLAYSRSALDKLLVKISLIQK